MCCHSFISVTWGFSDAHDLTGACVPAGWLFLCTVSGLSCCFCGHWVRVITYSDSFRCFYRLPYLALVYLCFGPSCRKLGVSGLSFAAPFPPVFVELESLAYPLRGSHVSWRTCLVRLMVMLEPHQKHYLL